MIEKLVKLGFVLLAFLIISVPVLVYLGVGAIIIHFVRKFW